ncbi:double-stranded RNA-binding protein 1-like [Vigna radiata var. radiata]|uniref:Double-stranded RNA-binding protein 1-like n=1 Tax=Vigna radiata var. radiata TaxID=3916 RepID=A0A3Q0FIR4_VIGRR|nr:double-stranded RNA-binding protein 1-like [Vigna radiata var. radiata]
MYKTKLQELCHKRKWGLPRYSAMKDGPDHIPSFKASVHVNGLIFTSSSASSSLKEAKNKAAMVAFLSFCSGSSTQTSEQDTKEQIRAVKPQGSSIPAQSSVIIDDMDCIHRIQLQNNARMNNLDPPVFACKTEKLPPANDFKATLLVDGHSIESPSVTNTIKETERASGLMSLSPDIFEKGESDSFKTSIMKLTVREGIHKPTYKTVQAGCPYMPTFFSTLEVEGVEFHGKGCRSKREAEEDAAKIAYIVLKKCGLSMYAVFSPSPIEHKAVQSILGSDIFKCIQNLKLEDLNDTLYENVKVANEEEQKSSFMQSPYE